VLLKGYAQFIEEEAAAYPEPTIRAAKLLPADLEHNPRADRRYRMLPTDARYVLLVGVLSYADERGLIEPEHEIVDRSGLGRKGVRI
jgi:hypothetical protein